MKNKDLRVVKTLNLIKNSFYQLLEEENFEKINISQICQLAQIGRSTFYQHYVDKYQLLDQENQYYLAKFADAMKTRVKTYQDPTSLQILIDKLKDERRQILLLLKVHGGDTDLTTMFEEVISDSAQHLINLQPKGNLSSQFIKQLYTANVMTFIVWSLKKGTNQQISSFMNESLKQEYNLWLKY